MTSRAAALEAIAHRIADYRLGEIPPITPTHVERWVRQFDPADQDIILDAMVGLLRAYYVPKAEATDFIRRLLADTRIFGPTFQGHPFTHFLNIQRKGNSQDDLLNIAEQILATTLVSSVSTQNQRRK